MPTTHLRTQIRAAALACLTGLTTTGTRAYEGRSTPLPADASPSLLIDVGEEQVATSSMGGAARNRILQRSLMLEVRAAVKSTGGYLDTLDQIALEVEQTFGTQQSLGGLAKSVQLSGIDAPEIDGQGEKTVAYLTMRFEVEYYASLSAPQTPR